MAARRFVFAAMEPFSKGHTHRFFNTEGRI
jgi:hypothetical protein